jgi:hypothetical protein
MGAGAVNHFPSMPLTCIPTSVPFRAIAVTIVLFWIPRAASRLALHAAIEKLRKNQLLKLNV